MTSAPTAHPNGSHPGVGHLSSGVATQPRPPAPPSADQTAAGIDLQRPVGVPTAPRRPRNTMWMVAGAVLVLLSGLSALVIAQSLSNRVDVLVATRDIARGRVITDDDLSTASISATSGVKAIDPGRRGEIVGQIATGPIGPGTILHPAQFVDGAAGDGEKVIVGAALAPGQFPRFGLNPGDEVVLMEVSSRTAVADDGLSAGPRELGRAEVVEVVDLTDPDTLLVTLRVNAALAVSISERAEQGRLRLGLVDNGFPDEVVKPLDPAEPVKPAEPNATAATPGDGTATTPTSALTATTQG